MGNILQNRPESWSLYTVYISPAYFDLIGHPQHFDWLAIHHKHLIWLAIHHKHFDIDELCNAGAEGCLSLQTRIYPCFS